MDSDSSDICRAGGSGHQQAVCFVQEMGVSVRIVYVLYDFGGIEQDHNVVRQKTDSIDPELFFRKRDRTGFGHAEPSGYHRNVNTAGVRPTGEVFALAVTCRLWTSRTDCCSAWHAA